jgi:hypothetical protein
MIFFIFKKLFLKLAHQNDTKHIKKKINKKNLIFLETRVQPRFQTLKSIR